MLHQDDMIDPHHPQSLATVDQSSESADAVVAAAAVAAQESQQSLAAAVAAAEAAAHKEAAAFAAQLRQANDGMAFDASGNAQFNDPATSISGGGVNADAIIKSNANNESKASKRASAASNGGAGNANGDLSGKRTKKTNIVNDNKRQRKSYSDEQRKHLRQFFFAQKQQGNAVNINICRDWWRRTYNTEINQSIISKILSPKYAYLDNTNHHFRPKLKRERPCKWPHLENRLVEWYDDWRARNIHVSGETLKRKAQEIWDTLECYKHESPPRFSNGWLEKFKDRHGLTHSNSHSNSNTPNASMSAGGVPQGSPSNKENIGMTLNMGALSSAHHMDRSAYAQSVPFGFGATNGQAPGSPSTSSMNLDHQQLVHSAGSSASSNPATGARVGQQGNTTTDLVGRQTSYMHHHSPHGQIGHESYFINPMNVPLSGGPYNPSPNSAPSQPSGTNQQQANVMNRPASMQKS